MKKLSIISLVLVLLLVLVACGSKSTTDTINQQESNTESSTKSDASSTSTESSTTAESNEQVTIIITNGKGEVAKQHAAAAEAFMKAHPDIIVEQYTGAVGETVNIFDTLTSSGKIITLAMMEPNAALDRYQDWGIDLSGEAWVAETVYGLTNPSGVLVAFPYAIEGMGLVYNKSVVEAAVGGTFDPFSIVTRNDLVDLLEKIKASGIEYPIAYQTEGWSVANHFGSMFMNQNEDPMDTVKAIEAGTFDFGSNDVWNNYFDTMDILKDPKYNMFGERPIGQYYDQAHVAVGQGQAAMLFNGNWAFDSLQALDEADFGFIPVPNDNSSDNRLNGKIVAGPTQIYMINKEATLAQQEAAKAYLNWLVFDEVGQDYVVNESQIISPFKNNPYKVTNPLGAAIAEAIAIDKVLPFSTNYISAGDYFSILGPEVQKYIGGVINRDELAAAYQTYYQEN